MLFRLGLVTSGALGSGRLAAVGVPALLTGAMLGGELVLGAAVSLGVRLARRSLAGPPSRPAEELEPAGRLTP